MQGDDGLTGHYPSADQHRFGKLILNDMGFQSTHGRLDTSAHPITFSAGSADVRLTTGYKENNFVNGMFGILHEGGHGLYELGFQKNIQGNLLAQAASMALHEAQAKTWENTIGRSRHFWAYYLPILKSFFPNSIYCRGVVSALKSDKPFTIER